MPLDKLDQLVPLDKLVVSVPLVKQVHKGRRVHKVILEVPQVLQDNKAQLDKPVNKDPLVLRVLGPQEPLDRED